MSTRKLVAAAAFVSMACGSALGAASLEFIGDGIGVTDISYDGRVVVGNTVSDNAYETWRWVAGDPDGWQRLGLATVPVLGAGGGSPDVSYDGTRVSATILGGASGGDRSELYQTSGIWTLGQGWTELFPPLPPDCVFVDSGYASAWGLSGNGVYLTGFYWRSTAGGAGGAHPSISSIAGGNVGLPTNGNRSARVNAANYDGTVVAGWEARPDGAWRPAAWRNGVEYILTDTPVLAMAEGINADGSVIVGSTYNVQADRRNAARWDWNGTSYVLTDLGTLPETPQTFIARVFATSVTADGSMIVGVNRFQDNGPFSIATGFVWTQATGMRDIQEVAAEAGAPFPENFMVVSLEVSGDGSAIAGMGINTAETFFLDWKSFVFRFTPLPECNADLTGDGVTNASDFNVLASNFGAGPGKSRAQGDLTDDGYVNASDFNVLAGDFGCGWPND